MKNVMRVDKKKLVQKLKDAGYTMGSFSRAMGRDDSYIAAMVRKHNAINQTTALLLASIAGISYSEIEPEKKVEELPVISAQELSKEEFDSVDKLMGRLKGFQMNILNGIETAREMAGSKGKYDMNFDDYTNRIVSAILRAVEIILTNIDIF